MLIIKSIIQSENRNAAALTQGLEFSPKVETKVNLSNTQKKQKNSDFWRFLGQKWQICVKNIQQITDFWNFDSINQWNKNCLWRTLIRYKCSASSFFNYYCYYYYFLNFFFSRGICMIVSSVTGFYGLEVGADVWYFIIKTFRWVDIDAFYWNKGEILLFSSERSEWRVCVSSPSHQDFPSDLLRC